MTVEEIDKAIDRAKNLLKNPFTYGIGVQLLHNLSDLLRAEMLVKLGAKSERSEKKH